MRQVMERCMKSREKDKSLCLEQKWKRKINKFSDIFHFYMLFRGCQVNLSIPTQFIFKRPLTALYFMTCELLLLQEESLFFKFFFSDFLMQNEKVVWTVKAFLF